MGLSTLKSPKKAIFFAEIPCYDWR